MDAPPPVNRSTRPHPGPSNLPPKPSATYFPPTASKPAEQIPAAQLSAKWDCHVCQRAFFERERTTHLASRGHRLAAENTRMREEPTPRVALSAGLAVFVSNRRADGEQEVVLAMPDLWECALCGCSMRISSMESHLRGKPHAKSLAKWEAEQQDVGGVELARAEWITEKRKNEGMEWWDLENRKKEQREELRRTEERRLEEQQRIKEEQKRDAAAASEQLWTAHENQKNELVKLQAAQEKQRIEWMERLEEALASSRQMESQLRIQQEERRGEWMRKQEEEDAAAVELVRRQEQEEAWRQQELQREQEREEAQRIAEEAAIEMEHRRREDEKEHQKQLQQEVADRLAREQAYLPSPGSFVGPAGWFEQGEPITQNIRTGAGPLDASSEASIRQYLHWQSISQEIHQQQVWMEQRAVLTFPMPITSVTKLPPILYRVYDETSVSQYSSEGFTAAASSMPGDPFHFKNMVDLHGNWSSRENSPFISVTSTPDGAARQIRIRQASRNHAYIMVALIDTASLLGPCQTSIWRMHDARDHFGLQPWKCHRRAFDHEYICALRIPAKAIFACCRPDFFKQNAVMFLKSLGWTGGIEMGGDGAL